ncbi:MAG: hypothetical protein JWL69_4453 [Phycisphaerales bacterium]|nr:hypothetical protein [Phycisphaerales bacterium]MDB5355726.1 hypothetical protein [Phycisphaerales bacterium]
MEVREPLRATPLPHASPRAALESERLSDRVLTFADRNRYWLFASIILLYVLGFNGQWRVERDSALYLSIGRNLAEGQGYTYHDHPHHLAFPGLPVFFAFTFKAFHTDSLVPALVLMLLMGWAVLALNYRLFLLHAGRPTAVLMTTGLGFTRLFYRYCFELMSDLPFLLGVMAFFVGFEALLERRSPDDVAGAETSNRRARWFDWGLLVGGLVIAVAMRPTMWVLLVAIFLALMWRAVRGQMTMRQIAIGLAVISAATALSLMVLKRGGSQAADDYSDYIRREKIEHFGQTLHDAIHDNVPELFPRATFAKALFGCPIGPLNIPAGVLVVGLSFWLLKRRALWGIWALLTIGMLLIQKPVDRYFLPVVPLLIFAWWRCLLWLNLRMRSARWANWVFIGLFLGAIGTNISRLGEMVVEQRRTPFLAHYREGRYESSYRVAAMVRDHIGKDDWVLVEPKVGRIMTFLSHRNALEPTDPSQSALARAALAKGRLFELEGSSLDESRSRLLPGTSAALREWVARQSGVVGAQAADEVKGPFDKEPWKLYRVEPK